jgi:hypothetical protein
MDKKIAYRILMTGLRVGLGLLVCNGLASSQDRYIRTTPTETDMYCSGVYTNKPFPRDIYVISGEDSRFKTTFQQGDLIYINRGAENGVKVGDQFEVVRPVQNLIAVAHPLDVMSDVAWFKYQTMLTNAMGTEYADVGRLRVVHVDQKTSTTEMNAGCDRLQRGDIVLPFTPRPAPQFHDVKFDPFAPPSGKKTAMVVIGKNSSILEAAGSVIYVNLGAAQGVRVGDYFRVFRYQGTRIETEYQEKNTAYKVFGYGSAPVAYEWNNLPRQIMGEGIVLRTGPNSSTVLLTTTRQEIYAGDYVELE